MRRERRVSHSLPRRLLFPINPYPDPFLLLLPLTSSSPPSPPAAAAPSTLTDKSRELGAGPLFNAILPLLMQPTLEDQERHLLVKVIDRCVFWGL